MRGHIAVVTDMASISEFIQVPNLSLLLLYQKQKMESLQTWDHDQVVREYLSDFFDEYDQVVESCPTSPTSPPTSSVSYARISINLAGYVPRPRRFTQGRNRRYTEE